MEYPRNSKMPLAAGIAMTVWMVLCYIPTYFGPANWLWIIANQEFWIWTLFALLSMAPVMLFFLFAAGRTTKNPKFLLLPWGLNALFTVQAPIVFSLMWERYRIYAGWGTPLWIRTAATFLLSAFAILFYWRLVTNRLKSKLLPLILTIALPVWTFSVNAAFFLRHIDAILNPSEAVLYHSSQSERVFSVMLPLAYDILCMLPYVLLIIGLKPANIEKPEGEPT